ncbi:hypothetical protein [Paractinoplanes lichenicola]|uniref:Uncharacterized protein n=1 Tax=Paractinoplanes lichenicola TaxID=2802976 RepID=A0ABS1VSR4_9ACTN|nr:hypothetical protein [Actinoplanes lichenicola]MBL7257431.1 hypothetical protein [Actinoplanes lichenicola]
MLVRRGRATVVRAGPGRLGGLGVAVQGRVSCAWSGVAQLVNAAGRAV